MVCETESAKAASDSHPVCPQPQGEERPGTYPRRTVCTMRRALDITRNCVTAAQYLRTILSRYTTGRYVKELHLHIL